jgi:hypothetical protein
MTWKTVVDGDKEEDRENVVAILRVAWVFVIIENGH